MLLPIFYSILLFTCMLVQADSLHIQSTKTVQLPFVIHICSYNNIQWVDKNLDSVFM